MDRKGLAILGASAAVAGAAGLAEAGVVIYQNDFESGALGSEWSGPRRLDGNRHFTRFNGRYGSEAIRLTLPAVPPPGGATGVAIGGLGSGGKVGSGPGGGGGGGDGGGGDGGGGDGGGGGGGGVPFILYTVEFDFYAIDSWDGDGPPYGPDVFEVISNSGTLFHETISNGTIAQTYRAPDVGPVQLGYGSRWDDSIYRDIRLSFRVPDDAQSVNLKFRGVGLQLLNDESWGIDNVTLSYEVAYGAVPAPAGLGAGLGLLCIGGRRRAR